MNQTAYRPPTWTVMPPVIKNLLIINGLVFFATVAPQMRDVLFQWFALWPAGTPAVAPGRFGGLQAVPQFYPWQLVTTAFLHGGFGHIFFNMFGLWMFGMRIENTWGSQRFAFFYFFCVVGASLLQLLVTSAPFWFGIGDPVIVPTVGASGGVFGVLLAFGMMYPEERVMLLFPPIPIKAKWFVTGLIVLQLYSGISGTQAGVANFAHLGGALAGFLLIQYWRGKLPIGPQPRRSVH